MFQTGSINFSSVLGSVAFGLVLPVALLLAACASPPTEDEFRAEYLEFVSSRNSCSTVDDCALVEPGCPLDCATGVNKAYVAEVEAKADELISEYRSGGIICEAMCLSPSLSCKAGRCEAY